MAWAINLGMDSSSTLFSDGLYFSPLLSSPLLTYGNYEQHGRLWLLLLLDGLLLLNVLNKLQATIYSQLGANEMLLLLLTIMMM